MAKQTLTTYGPAKVSGNNNSSSGILSVWVQQPTNTSPSDDGTIRYTEQWKGPYSVGKDILSHVKSGDTLAHLHSVLGSDRVYRIATAECPVRDGKTGIWKIDGIEVDEMDAGDHCMLNIRCVADYSTVDVSSGLSKIDENDTWSIQW